MNQIYYKPTTDEIGVLEYYDLAPLMEVGDCCCFFTLDLSQWFYVGEL